MSAPAQARFLVCRDVSKAFDATTAVDRASIEVPQGQIFALLGPSGCGKTTLLRLIAGFEAPDAGAIELDGRLLVGRGQYVAPEKRKVAIVFQDFALFPHMNVSRNVAFGLPAHADRRTRVAELLDLVGLTDLERRMPHELSGGQQQRVALARALASEPTLILLDEPFSNLDPSIRQRVRSEVKQLIQAVGITALFVTHDQEEALSLAEGVAVMMDGRIVQSGTPTEIYSRPQNRTVAEFIGEANFIPGEVHEGVASSELGQLHVATPDGAVLTGPVDLMIRAEDIVLSDDGGATSEVVALDFYGHDQMATVRVPSGTLLKVRLPAGRRTAAGDRVDIVVPGEVLAFPSG